MAYDQRTLIFLFACCMKQISSKDNPRYKHWYKVAQGKVRHEVLLEGTHLCEMSLRTLGVPEQVILREDVLQIESGQGDAQLHNLLAELEQEQIVVLPANLFQALSSVPSPQGILFHIKVPIAELIPQPQKTSVYLERIQDPGNLGTIIRTCAAADIETIYLSPACVNPWSTKVLRSAQGAHFTLNLYTNVDVQTFFATNRLPVYVTYLSAQAKSLYTTQFPKELIWVFGNEGQGVSGEVLNLAQEQVFIPQSSRVESLNVGVACGIVLFEHKRQWQA